MLREAHESIADKGGIIEDNERMMKFLNDEKEELTRENQVRLDPVRIIKGSLCVIDARLITCFSFLQNLQNNIEELRRAYDELHAAPPADTTYPHAQPGTNSPAGNTSFNLEQMETAGQAGENLYENIGEWQALFNLILSHLQLLFRWSNVLNVKNVFFEGLEISEDVFWIVALNWM